MAKFIDVKKELIAGVKKSKSGAPIHSFSKSDFNTLINAMLNDPTYEMETVKMEDGKLVNVTTPVVRELREKFIKPILVDFGVPKTDAERIADDYTFKSSQTAVLYNFIADAIYQYMDAGKKFNFPNRKDFSGSVNIQEIDEKVVERDLRDIKDRSKVIGHKKEKRDKHKVLVKKSVCPTWMRHVM